MGKKRNGRAVLRLDFPNQKSGPVEGSKSVPAVKSQAPSNKPCSTSVTSQVQPVKATTSALLSANLEGNVTDSEFETVLDKLSSRACDLESLNMFAEAWESAYALKMDYRSRNSTPSYEEFDALRRSKKLDSTLKKCTGFVKKVKNYTDVQRDSIEKEIQTLNLSKYLGEIATAIAEAKIKISDINGVLSICSMVHQRYSDFSPMLLENFRRVMPQKRIECSPSTLKKLSCDLRLLGDLIAVGILPTAESFSLLLNSIRNVIAADRDGMQCLIPILSFCRGVGDEMAGILPRNIMVLCKENSVKLSRYDVVPVDKRVLMKTLLREYFVSMCGILLKFQEEVLKSEIYNRKLMKNRGEIPEDRQAAHNDIVANFEKFNLNAAKLAELLNENLPELKSLPPPAPDEVEDRAFSPSTAEDNAVVPGIVIFEDEDTRAFYQDLPDLKVYLPPVAYRENVLLAAEEAKKIEEREMQVANVDDDIVQAELSAEKLDIEDEPEDLPPSLRGETEDEKREDAQIKPSFQIFLTSLLNCVTKEMIDKAAMEFAMNYNNRPNRKKLTRWLFQIPRQRVDLLPLWARLVAILAPVMPDVSMEICALLKSDFRFLVRKKHQIFIETKLKITRFIAELVNFKIFPKSDAFQCLKTLLMDFVHHQIEMACAFVETCGRFLHRSSESRRRMTIYLEEMMRKKAAKALEPRYVGMVDHAYYFVCPREGVQRSINKRRPAVAYLRNMVLYNLNKDNLESTIAVMKGLDWSNEKITSIVLELLCQPWETSSDQLRYLASFAAGVSEICPKMKTILTDTIIELIYYGMERPDTSENYRRIAVIRYLGELYNYKLIGSTSIFSTLYLLICYDLVTINPLHWEHLDPPHNLMRIRLTCTLLKTCGDYLNHGPNKKKLNYFLLYFQRYYWNKKRSSIWSNLNQFPFAIEELMEDTVHWLRPKSKFPTSYEQASEEVQEMEAKMIKYAEEIFEEQPNLLTDVGTTPIKPRTYLEGHKGSQDKVGDKFTWNADANLDIRHLNDGIPIDGADNEGQFVNDTEYGDDDTFNQLFDRMCSEVNYNAARERMKSDIPIPLKLRSSSRSVPAAPEENSEGEKTVNFVLITRKGNKQNYKNLSVPADSEFVQKIQQREEDERLEKEKVKALTLGISMIQEAEEEQEAIARINNRSQQVPTPQYGWKNCIKS